MAQDTKGLIYVPEIDLYFIEERFLLGLLGKDWQTTKDILKIREMAMPTPSQFRGFLKHLRDTPEYQEFYNEIVECGGPWRGKWLNARFEEREDGMYMISEDALINGEYQDQILKLDDCLMENRGAISSDDFIGDMFIGDNKHLSLDEWLDSNTLHGLPPANISDGNSHYLYPKNGRVTAFIGGSGGSLLCNLYPWELGSALGVFVAHKN